MPRNIIRNILKKYSLPAILLLAAFLRLYRINELLGFWYDQGRDALVIWDFIHKGKFFLIGPMMANTGIYRGPWYYWLITPFYWLGNGNPVWPAVFLIITSVIAIYLVYKLDGWLPAFLAAISFYVISASRWLADPTPTLLVSVILIWALYNILKKKSWALPLIGFMVGLALNFSAATEIFYIPALLVIFYIKRKNLPNIKTILLSILIFLVTFIPQMLFELRHPGVQSGAFVQFILNQNSFTLSFWQLVVKRLPFYYLLISNKFWINGELFFAPFFIYFVARLIFRWKEFWKDDKFKILFISSIAPIVGTLFFNGSEGNVYEYYYTGFYFIWILLFAKVVTNRWVISGLVIVSLIFNFTAYQKTYINPESDMNYISFDNQLEAIDWIYSDSKGGNFNIDVYVPPVVPYSYQYLFRWLGTTRYHRQPVSQNVSLLYTLHEADPGFPERVDVWMIRQKTIGKIEETVTFGGITVERRERLNVK